MVRGVIEGLENVTRFNTGGAFGIDSFTANYAARYHPGAEHFLYFPLGKWFNTDLLDRTHWKDKIAISGGYMKRNDVLVAACDILLAFPRTKSEELRSGTWATVRRARKEGKPVWYFPLDGSEPFEEL